MTAIPPHGQIMDISYRLLQAGLSLTDYLAHMFCPSCEKQHFVQWETYILCKKYKKLQVLEKLDV